MSQTRMLQAFHKGVSQLNDRETRKVVWICVGSAVLAFIFLWSSIGMVLQNTTLFEWGLLETIIDWLGGAATFILTWFLFPGVVTALIGLYLDKIVDRVEAMHYPHLSPAPRLDFVKSLIEIAKFLGVLIVVNIMVLFFLIPPLTPLFPFVFYGANGYLLSREYFELVALRRMSPVEARARKSVV